MQLELAVHSAVPARDLGIQVALYSQATERSYFEQSLTGDTAGFTPLDEPPIIPLTAAHLALGRATIDLPISAPGVPGKLRHAPSNGALLSIPCTTECTGVYPLQVFLVDLRDATTLDSFMTYLVIVPPTADYPLRFSFVLTIGSAPAIRPSGVPDPSPADEREIVELRNALALQPAARLSVALYPQLLSGIELAAAGGHGISNAERTRARTALQALKQLSSMGNVEIEPETYSAIDPAQLARQSLGGQLAAQLRAGASQVHLIGARRSGLFVATSSPGRAGLRLLNSHGADRLLVPSSSVTPVPSDWVFPVWAPFLVRKTGVEVDASDYYLERHLESGSDPVLRANQLLADLAVLFFSLQPQENRGVTLLAPPKWRPSQSFLQTLIPALGTGTIVKPLVLSQFFSQVPPGSAEQPLLFRSLVPARPAGNGHLPNSVISKSEREISGLSSLSSHEARRVAKLRELLLLSETAGLSPSTRLDYLGAPATALQAAASKLSLPRNRTITVTSLSARVPITLYSSAAEPIHAQLRLRSPDLGFRRRVVPVTLRPRNNTIEVRVSARTAGDFPLNLELTTVSGSVRLATGNLLIRSTAISSVAVGLTAGAAAFLVLWWARSALKRRRARPVKAA